MKTAREADRGSIMKSLQRSLRAFEGRDIAPEIYIPLVDSLYQEGRTLLVGYTAATSAILLTYWKTGDIWLLACAFAFSVVAVGRSRVREVERERAALGDSLRRGCGIVLGDPGNVVLFRPHGDE